MVPAPDAAQSNSADLLAFFQPPRDQRIWGRLFTNRQDWPYGSNRYEVYLTYTALVLGAIGLFAGRKRGAVITQERSQTDVVQTNRLPGKWFWASCAAIFFALALGPVLQINGQQVGWLPMPYSLIDRLPLLNISRSPDRFDMPLTLCLGVLAGFGVNALATRRPRFASAAPVISLTAVALIMLELAPAPYIQREAVIPRWYSQLAQEPGDFSILELPPQDDYWHGAFRMYYQTAHHKRIFGGYISREFPHPFLSSTPGYQELTYVDGEGDMFEANKDTWYSAFERYDTRYIVLLKDRLLEVSEEAQDVTPSREAIESVLGGAAPVYEDEQLAAYKVPKPERSVPFLSVGDGWGPREKGPNGTFRWMGDNATLQVDSPDRRDATLRFRAASLGPPRGLQIFHGDNLVFEGDVGPLQEYTTGPLGLPEGTSTLRFVSPTGTTSPAAMGQGSDPRQLSFALLDVGLDTSRSE